MPTTNLTDATFGDTIEKNDIVLVDYWADWCPPCRAFGPIFEASSDANPDIVYAKVDTEAQPALFTATGSTAIPTLQAFRDGICVFSQAGALPGPQLAEVVAAVRALDMDEVRAQVAGPSS